MSKNLENPIAKGSRHDEAVRIVADKYGVTPRYVRYVRDGDRDNEKVLDAYLTVRQALNTAMCELPNGVVPTRN